MLRALPYAIGYLLAPALVAGASLGGWWTVLPAALVYVGVPVVDALAAPNPANAGGRERPALSANPWFRAITWGWVPVQLALVLWVIDRVSGPLAASERVGLVVSLGLTTGAVGITFAHELLHRPGWWERALAEVLLHSASYPHYAIEHVWGHHRHVGTPRDRATARLGESLYRFLPRTVWGSLASAWRIERERVARRAPAAGWLANRFLRYGLAQAAVYASLAALWGPGAIAAFAGQAAVAVLLLETVNYIEHYGLARREVASGRYEPISAAHSWNSCHRVSNWMLINLARHADHHLAASKRYQVLDHLERAPQLPASYGTMLLTALVPPVWRRIMDPRVAEYSGGR